MDANDITQLLDAAVAGDAIAKDEAFQVLYPHLRAIAHARRRDWRGQYTLNTTALIHEAFLKVAGHGGIKFENRSHFYATTARAMRQVLINYAEKSVADKRGGGVAPVTLHEDHASTPDAMEELLALDSAMRKLEATSPRAARVVDCMFFVGLNIAETAEALGISEATVKRDWATARAWLYREMREDSEG